MKMALICYVLPRRVSCASATPALIDTAEVSPYVHLFPQQHAPNNPPHFHNIAWGSPACLDSLEVRPVTVLIRRLPAKAETYCTAGAIHAKYRAKSVLKKPRVAAVGAATKPKKRRKRRDPAEMRAKGQSKANKLWSTLLLVPGSTTIGHVSTVTVDDHPIRHENSSS